jgi:hypothetical protein
MCSIKKPEIVIEHSKTTQKMQIWEDKKWALYVNYFTLLFRARLLGDTRTGPNERQQGSD